MCAYTDVCVCVCVCVCALCVCGTLGGGDDIYSHSLVSTRLRVHCKSDTIRGNLLADHNLLSGPTHAFLLPVGGPRMASTTCMHTARSVCTRHEVYAHGTTHTARRTRHYTYTHTALHVYTRHYTYTHGTTCMHTALRVCTRHCTYAHGNVSVHTALDARR